jgi:hypothetical protein
MTDFLNNQGMQKRYTIIRQVGYAPLGRRDSTQGCRSWLSADLCGPTALELSVCHSHRPAGRGEVYGSYLTVTIPAPA